MHSALRKAYSHSFVRHLTIAVVCWVPLGCALDRRLTFVALMGGALTLAVAVPFALAARRLRRRI